MINKHNKQNKNNTFTDKEAVDLITDMYNNMKFEDYTFLREHRTAKLLEKLEADYEYSCPEKDRYAVRDFRTGLQDDTKKLHKIINVISLGNGRYNYIFYDMGIKGSERITLIKENHKIIMDDLKQYIVTTK